MCQIDDTSTSDTARTWKSNLQAYGIISLTTRFELLQPIQNERISMPAFDSSFCRGLTHAPAIVAHEAALLAHVDLESIGRNHQALEQKLSCAVCDQAIALHLSKTQTAVARSAFGWLASQDGSRTFGASVHLVQNL